MHKARLTTWSCLQHSGIFSVLFVLSHHAVFLAFVAVAVVQTEAPNALMLFLPLVTAQATISFAALVYELATLQTPVARYPLVMNMRAKHLTILGFVYAFGYFIPTLSLVQEAKTDIKVIGYYIVNGATMDIMFTVLLSSVLLKRHCLRKLGAGRSLVPIIVCTLTILASATVSIKRDGDKKLTLVFEYLD